MNEQLAFSPIQVATMLGGSKNLVYEMLRTGQIKSIRCGSSRKRLIISKDAIDEFLSGKETVTQ